MPPTEEETQTPPAREQETGSSNNGIDLKALAEKVYELLKKEARIERERTGHRRR
jgi:hypothetical protein